MADSIDIQREPGPIMVLTYDGRPSDQAFQEYLDTYSGILDEGERYAALLLTTADARMTPVSQARMQAKWIAENEARLRELCAGIAFVLPSPVARGVYRAILRMQPLPMPHMVTADEGEARAWIQERLEAHPVASSG